MDATTSQGSSALFPMPQEQLLSPPRPSLSSLSLSSSSSYSHHGPPSITNFPILVLTVLGILTTSVLLLAYYVFVIRCCLNWHHHRSSTTNIPGARGRRQRQRAATSSRTALPVSAAAEPRGLDEASIRALPAFRYSARKKDAATGPGPASECAVCLGEFEDEERVRLLPGCLHVFHLACIDTWLQANANCPLCRADIAAHCLPLLPLPPLPPPLHQPADQQDQEVAIQLELGLVAGAEQQDQATTQAQQREAAATAAAPETAGEAAAADNQVVVVVVGGQRQTIVSACCHEIDLGSEVDECTEASKDGDVVPLPPRRRSSSSSSSSSSSTSTGTTAGAGGEVRLQIQNILQGNDTRSHRDGDHGSDSSGSVFSVV